MSNNVSYSFVTSNSNTFTFRSTVNSFGLDHTTDKDIVSFYSQFSNISHIDTGLLPVDGSGLLSVRSAGPHTQIAYQHKPGMYYINWGSHEGDKNAVKYYVAQPYRIVVADLLNGNILGARTFYSPVPITYPEAPLYHVNLPNINCKGYRGNAVGWICLYHNEDISQYPFNEKVAKILDRCSGTEAYNDHNMSETDGPRFYAQNCKPIHLSDPNEWQSYSYHNGYEWTLDPDLWIPILVQDRDHQDRHDSKGQPLTFLDAITGTCRMYYYDENPVKPYNMISRPDLSLSSSLVFSWFKNSYNTSASTFKNVFVFDAASELRTQASTQQSQLFEFDTQDTQDLVTCDSCGENDHVDNMTKILGDFDYCSHCISEYTCWVEHIGMYVYQENEALYYDEDSDKYYYLPEWSKHKSCDSCGYIHIYQKSENQVNIWSTNDNNMSSPICSKCLPSSDSKIPTAQCCYCKTTVPLSSYDNKKVPLNDKDENGNTVFDVYCNTCWYDHVITKAF